jgi:hypothetical protein
MNNRLIPIAFAALVAALSGCSKEEKPTVSLDELKSPEKLKKAIEKKEAAAAPKADKSVPIEQYKELSDGKQLMFTVLAASKMPVDYEKIAGIISSDYRSTKDEFKKKDLLTALKPGIDAEVEKAKGELYLYMDVSDSINKYDFESKSFPVPSFRETGSLRYFHKMPAYNLTFSNQKDFSDFPVADETAARNIESMRTKYQQMKIRIYFFASGTKLGDPTLTGEVTKIRLLDSKGAVLAER